MGLAACVDPPPEVAPEGSSSSGPAVDPTTLDPSTSSSGAVDTTVASSTGPGNQPPLAEPDEYCTQQAAGLFTSPFSILDNDTDLDGTFTLTSVGRLPTAFGGTVDIAEDGTFTYVAAPEFSGDDGFVYMVEDDMGVVAGATVTLRVAALHVDLADVTNGVGGFAVTGDSADQHRAGYVVAGAGDVNDDGLSDVIVGAHRGTGNMAGFAGQSFVVFGKVDGDPVDLIEIDQELSPDGFAIHGADASHFAGFDVASAGDIDDDGFDDVLVGAPGFDTDELRGRAYLVRGRAETTVVDLSAIEAGDTTVGVAFTGLPFGRVGVALDGGRDVDGDGLPDLLLAAPATDQEMVTPSTYLLFDFPLDSTPVDLTTLLPAQGSTLAGLFGEWSGRPARLLGDIDGDGLSDFAVGDRLGPDLRGVAYVRLSSQGVGDFDAAQLLLGIGGFAVQGIDAEDQLGNAISGAGDFDGDGIEDLLLGAPGRVFGKAEGGVAYLMFGGQLSPPPTLADLEAGIGGMVIVGDDTTFAQTGFAVQGIGDFNGDGRDDLVVSSPSVFDVTNQGCLTGRSYIVFGNDEPGPVLLSTIATGVGGLAIDSESAKKMDCAGWSLGAAGDTDGDGLTDIVIGAPRVGDFAGRAYVVRGFTPEHPRACPS